MHGGWRGLGFRLQGRLDNHDHIPLRDALTDEAEGTRRGDVKAEEIDQQAYSYPRPDSPSREYAPLDMALGKVGQGYKLPSATYKLQETHVSLGLTQLIIQEHVMKDTSMLRIGMETNLWDKCKVLWILNLVNRLLEITNDQVIPLISLLRGIRTPHTRVHFRIGVNEKEKGGKGTGFPSKSLT